MLIGDPPGVPLLESVKLTRIDGDLDGDDDGHRLSPAPSGVHRNLLYQIPDLLDVGYVLD